MAEVKNNTSTPGVDEDINSNNNHNNNDGDNNNNNNNNGGGMTRCGRCNGLHATKSCYHDPAKMLQSGQMVGLSRRNLVRRNWNLVQWLYSSPIFRFFCY